MHDQGSEVRCAIDPLTVRSATPRRATTSSYADELLGVKRDRPVHPVTVTAAIVGLVVLIVFVLLVSIQREKLRDWPGPDLRDYTHSRSQ